MTSTKQSRYTYLLLAWLVGLVLWRVLAAMHANLELYGDEAQYWTWSLNPTWGYYSKPPVVAWLIWLGTHMFGSSELGVRSPAYLLYALTAWVVFLLVRRLFRDEPQAGLMAFWAGLLFATLPMVSLGSWIVTTDAPLLLSWALAMYFTVAALETGSWRDWLLLGAAVGIGLMSKYSMVFYGLGLVVYLAVSPERRHLFKDPKLYVSAALAFLILVPNIVWNADHQFVSLHHTEQISELNRSLFHPEALLSFFLAQFGVFGPIAGGWLLVFALRPRDWFSDDRLRLLASFTLAPIASFLLLSLLSRAFANWVAFAYVSGAALVAPYILMKGRRGWLVGALALNLVMGVAVYNFHDITRLLHVQLYRHNHLGEDHIGDPYGRMTGFRALGIEVGKRLKAHPGAHFLTDDRMLYALIRYYGRPYSKGGLYLNVSGKINNHYALTADVRKHPKGEFLLISQHLTDPQVDHWFAQATPQPAIRFNLYPDFAPEYHVWLVRDYIRGQK